MFSGIVKQTSPVTRVEAREGLLRISVDVGAYADGLQHGSSVSIAGVCLTAVDIQSGVVTFDVMQETLDKTTLATVKEGDRVNTERAVRVGDEMGGHRVSGHITGIAKIMNKVVSPNNCVLTFSAESTWMEAILPKGFIALDGCSLTVVEVGMDWFTVHLIPETLAITTFGSKNVSDSVNLELDPETQAIVATVKRHLAATAG